MDYRIPTYFPLGSLVFSSNFILTEPPVISGLVQQESGQRTATTTGPTYPWSPLCIPAYTERTSRQQTGGRPFCLDGECWGHVNWNPLSRRSAFCPLFLRGNGLESSPDTERRRLQTRQKRCQMLFLVFGRAVINKTNIGCSSIGRRRFLFRSHQGQTAARPTAD